MPHFLFCREERRRKSLIPSTIKISSSCAILKMIIFSSWIIFLGSSVLTCANKTVNDRGGEKEMSAKSIEEVLKEHTEQLMSLSGVVGTAQGLCDGQACVKVFVIKKTPELEQKILNILEGYPVAIEETGRIRALPENQD